MTAIYFNDTPAEVICEGCGSAHGDGSVCGPVVHIWAPHTICWSVTEKDHVLRYVLNCTDCNTTVERLGRHESQRWAESHLCGDAR